MISRCLLVFITNIQAALLIGFTAYMFGLDFEIQDLTLFFYTLVATMILGFTFGLFLGSLSQFYPFVAKVWAVLKGLLMFVSSVFIPIDRRFPSDVVEILSYNPLLQLIEGCRESASIKYYMFSHLDISYINYFIMTTLILGLLLNQAVNLGDKQ